jgi:hypothetical protein
MSASIAFQWRHADLIVLSALYGRRAADAVFSRPARKPVSVPRKSTPAAGIPIPCQRAA